MLKKNTLIALIFYGIIFQAFIHSAYAQISEFKFTAADADTGDSFGFSAAISGDYTIVGAFTDDDNGPSSGSAYIFKRDGTSWTEEAKLLASDGDTSDQFGYSVSIDGEYAVVGVRNDDDDNGDNSGAAIVFKRTGTTWTQETKLLASDGAGHDSFGEAVSISGDYIFVGAYRDDDLGESTGSVYVFRRNGTNWFEEEKLLPSDVALFGESTSISGDYAIVGAPGGESISAYVFKHNGTSWVEEAKLSPPEVEIGDGFGESVSISGEYVIVGAPRDDDNGNISGSAYMFKRSGVSWRREAKLLPSDGSAQDFFGFSVSISKNYAVVGSFFDDDNGTNSGSAYLYERTTKWTQVEKFHASDGAAFDRFGQSVSISGDYAVIGAFANDDDGTSSGSAYIYNGFISHDPYVANPIPDIEAGKDFGMIRVALLDTVFDDHDLPNDSLIFSLSISSALITGNISGDTLFIFSVLDSNGVVGVVVSATDDSLITVSTGFAVAIKDFSSVVINEIMQNPSSVNDSEGEWFEIINTGTDFFNLDGWQIKDKDSDTHTITGTLILEPFKFLVLGNNANTELNGGVVLDYEYSGITLGNATDELIFVNSSGFVVDSVAWDDGLTFPDPNGASMVMNDPLHDNSIGNNWRVSATSFGTGDLGTPGTPNFIPLLSLDKTEITYDTTAAGTQASKFLKIYNRGDTTLTIDSIYTNTNVFYSSSEVPIILVAKDTLNLEIFFAPDTYGEVTDVLFVRSNSFNSELKTVMLSGFGFLPVSHIGLSDSNLVFLNTMVGASRSHNLIISNIGEDILVVDSIYSTDSVFTISLSDTFLIPGDSVITSITFTPDMIQSYSAQIIIDSNDPDNPQINISLEGDGIAPAPDIAIYPDSLDFGRVARGDSISGILIVVNEGLLDLEIAEASFSIPNTSPFWTDFTGASLAPGDSDTVMVFVRFDSTDENFEEDILTIFSDDPDDASLEVPISANTWRIIHIPNDFATIQEGIDASNDRDTILVAPGTYKEFLHINHNILLTSYLFYYPDSLSLIDSTIISSNEDTSVITIPSWTDSTLILNGFTIRDGNSNTFGGGIKSFGHPVLTNLIVTNNVAREGAGITFFGGSANVSNVIIVNNNSENEGAGILLWSLTDVKMKNVVISRNMTFSVSDAAGAIFLNRYSSLSLENSIISQNVDGYSIFGHRGASFNFDNVTISGNEGRIFLQSSVMNISNSIIWNNISGSNITFSGNGSVSLRFHHSNIQFGQEGFAFDHPDSLTVDWGTGNIDEDPLFCNPDSGIYTLAENSPSAGTGENGENMGAFDVGCDEIIVSIDDLHPAIPTEYSLHQNYPNPFNPTTSLSYDLPQGSDISLIIYNILGQEVMRWDEQSALPGYYEKSWNGTNRTGNPVASGIYIYKLIAGEFIQTRKMVLLK